MFFSLLACLPDLNGPVVLATGLGSPQAISLTAQERLLIGSDDGLYFVDYYGTVVQEKALAGRNIQSVAAHVDRLYALDAHGQIVWRSVDAVDWNSFKLEATPQHIMAWSDHQIILVFDDWLGLWSPESPDVHVWRSGFSSIADIAYDTEEGCGGVLLATSSGVYRSCEAGNQLMSDLKLELMSSSRNQLWGLQDGQIGLVVGHELRETRSFPAKEMSFGAIDPFPDHLLYGVMNDTLELTQCLPEKLAD